MLQGFIDKQRCCFFSIDRLVEQNFVDDFVWHDTAETVTAQHPAIAGGSLEDFGIYLRRDFNVAEHAHQHASAGVGERFFGRDAACVY